MQIATGGQKVTDQSAGANVIVDATISNTPIFIQTTSSQPTSLHGSIFLDNAKLNNVQINAKESSQGSVAVWDTHIRLGGFKGTNLQTQQCAKLQGHGAECAASFLALHLSKTSSAYLEVGVFSFI